METTLAITRTFTPLGSYRTYEEWKLLHFLKRCIHAVLVLTVPMRNGNPLPMLSIEEAEVVLTVPMRNGNHNRCPCYIRCSIGSYRTYEEWKHIFSHPSILATFSFLPYLWGMETMVFLQCSQSEQRSYRTYEEWKLGAVLRTLKAPICVLTVPMRNGNIARIKHLHYVCSKFLPYLWGMETGTMVNT